MSESVLPQITEVEALRLESFDDLLTDEQKADYAAWIADVQAKRRRGLEWAATHQMP